MLAAVKRNSALDYAATIGTLLGISVPNFLLATLLVLRLLPLAALAAADRLREVHRRSARQPASTMILPALSLGLPFAAVIMRNTRSAVLEVLGQEHVRVARAKGLRSGAC